MCSLSIVFFSVTTGAAIMQSSSLLLLLSYPDGETTSFVTSLASA
jgi:hypothetical protein